jgi:transposase
MDGRKYFLHPKLDWQRRYETLRASFFDRLPADVVAQRFDYTPAYIRLLRHQFLSGKIDFSEPNPEGKAHRHCISNDMRQKIRLWRENNMSAAEIAQCLSDEGHEVSIRTIERVLREEGFKKLPRRSLLKIRMTVKGTHIPDKAQSLSLSELN